MSLRKTDRADLRKDYPLYIEIGIIAAMVLMILAFKIDLPRGESFEIPTREQEIVEIEEVEQTEQIDRPPPPPKPQVPVEVPDDELIDDVPLELDAELDLDAEPTAAGPPPVPPKEESEEEPEIFVAVEQMPRLIGGIQELQKRIIYPEMAKKAGVEGTVVVQFVVDEEGRVVNPQILSGVGAGLDQAALNAVKDARFIPGKQRGQAVKVRFALPVTFRLQSYR